MADLEELALRRDRGYLVRLLLLMVVAVVFALFMYAWLTGSGVSGCLGGALGSEPPKQTQQAQPRR
jgi:hypothetical protein